MVSDSDLKKLIELAEKATPWPWEVGYDSEIIDHYHGWRAWAVGPKHKERPQIKPTELAIRDAEFIAASNPQTVSEMAKELLQWRKISEQMACIVDHAENIIRIYDNAKRNEEMK